MAPMAVPSQRRLGLCNIVVEVRRVFQEGSLCNILESVFGSNDKSEELRDMVREGYELIAMFNLEDYFPFKFLDFHGVKRRCHKLAAKVGSVVGQIVEERKRDGGFWWFWFLWLKEIVVASVWGSRKVRDYIVLCF